MVAVMAGEGITLMCTKCKMHNFRTVVNKKNQEKPLSIKKFCPKCRSHQLHKQLKK